MKKLSLLTFLALGSVAMPSYSMDTASAAANSGQQPTEMEEIQWDVNDIRGWVAFDNYREGEDPKNYPKNFIRRISGCNGFRATVATPEERRTILEGIILSTYMMGYDWLRNYIIQFKRKNPAYAEHYKQILTYAKASLPSTKISAMSPEEQAILALEPQFLDVKESLKEVLPNDIPMEDYGPALQKMFGPGEHTELDLAGMPQTNRVKKALRRTLSASALSHNSQIIDVQNNLRHLKEMIHEFNASPHNGEDLSQALHENASDLMRTMVGNFGFRSTVASPKERRDLIEAIIMCARIHGQNALTDFITPAKSTHPEYIEHFNQMEAFANAAIAQSTKFGGSLNSFLKRAHQHDKEFVSILNSMTPLLAMIDDIKEKNAAALRMNSSSTDRSSLRSGSSDSYSTARTLSSTHSSRSLSNFRAPGAIDSRFLADYPEGPGTTSAAGSSAAAAAAAAAALGNSDDFWASSATHDAAGATSASPTASPRHIIGSATRSTLHPSPLNFSGVAASGGLGGIPEGDESAGSSSSSGSSHATNGAIRAGSAFPLGGRSTTLQPADALGALQRSLSSTVGAAGSSASAAAAGASSPHGRPPLLAVVEGATDTLPHYSPISSHSSASSVASRHTGSLRSDSDMDVDEEAGRPAGATIRRGSTPHSPHSSIAAASSSAAAAAASTVVPADSGRAMPHAPASSRSLSPIRDTRALFDSLGSMSGSVHSHGSARVSTPPAGSRSPGTAPTPPVVAALEDVAASSTSSLGSRSASLSGDMTSNPTAHSPTIRAASGFGTATSPAVTSPGHHGMASPRAGASPHATASAAAAATASSTSSPVMPSPRASTPTDMGAAAGGAGAIATPSTPRSSAKATAATMRWPSAKKDFDRMVINKLSELGTSVPGMADYAPILDSRAKEDLLAQRHRHEVRRSFLEGIGRSDRPLWSMGDSSATVQTFIDQDTAKIAEIDAVLARRGEK